jgi:hypothetical protein
MTDAPVFLMKTCPLCLGDKSCPGPCGGPCCCCGGSGIVLKDPGDD